MSMIDFTTIDWETVAPTRHAGTTGESFWRTLHFGGIRMRIVEYSPGYLADHWCQKGHVVHCLAGEFVSESEDGEAVTLSEGMTYIVSDNMSSHRSLSANGAKLLIVDGTFLS